MSLLEALAKAEKILSEAGVDSPRLDAEILLGAVLGLPRHELYTRLHEPMDEEGLQSFMGLTLERARRTPLQYITGHTEFMSLDFLVKKGIFIPRPETELVVEAVLERVEATKELKIIDIGTGSGNIAISLAVSLGNIRVYASDISQKALRIARINAKRYFVEDRVHFLKGSVYEAFKGLGLEGKVDFIVSNPPYVPKGQWEGLQPEVRDYEDPRALLGGEDGLDCYRSIVEGAYQWLCPGGWLILELGEDQAARVKEVVVRDGHLHDIKLLQDLQGIERVIVARRTQRAEAGG